MVILEAQGEQVVFSGGLFLCIIQSHALDAQGTFVEAVQTIHLFLEQLDPPEVRIVRPLKGTLADA